MEEISGSESSSAEMDEFSSLPSFVVASLLPDGFKA